MVCLLRGFSAPVRAASISIDFGVDIHRIRKAVMENQRPAKRREEGSMEEDRISQLPLHILHHHILSLLPQNDAVGTCILSKSWRHLGPTRPKIEFDESSFPESKEKFLFVVENTLQRYDDQNLSIQEFDLGMTWGSDPQSISLLEKWIPVVLMNPGLKTFRLSADDFPLPPVVFQAEFLEELYLKDCELNQIFNSLGKVQALKRLRTLSIDSVSIEEENFDKIMSSFFPRLKSLYLQKVHLPTEWLNNLSSNNCLGTLSLISLRIENETFDKIMSICPLIQHLVLRLCKGLSSIKVKMARNLKHLDCHSIDSSIVINDAPSLETIRISNCQNWYLNKNTNYFFPRLKSLYLWNVHLPRQLLNNLSSNNCPCLQVLELRLCSGFREFKLSNRSIKRLIIDVPDRPIKAAIDAANMLYFEYKSSYLPSFSFAATSNEWESSIFMWRSYYNADAWYLKLYEFLKALSQSQICLDTSFLPLTNHDTTYGGICEPAVVVEHLCLSAYCLSYAIPALLNSMFRICRPRYIGLTFSATNSEKGIERQLWESIWKTLLKNGETMQCDFWHQDLEESSIQVLDKDEHEWRPGQVCEFSNNQSIRFLLKWRDLS